MIVWPFLWGLCAFLALVSHVAADTRAARVLLAALAGYILMRLNGEIFGGQPIQLAIAALIWGSVAGVALRLKFTTCGGLMALSALCYLWANSFDAPRVFGSLPFVASDVLMIAAMVGIGRNGLVSFWDGICDLDLRVDRDSNHPGRCRMAADTESQKGPR